MPGEVMALVGDNGAGKSTLIKCVPGSTQPTAASSSSRAHPVHIHGPKDAAALGIEVVYQDLALCDNLDIVQNMYLGRELIDPFRRLDEATMEERTARRSAGLAVTTIRSIRQNVASLSGGQRQSVAVAKAVMWNSKLVILDEPTAALGVAQTEQVLDLVRRLADQGLAVVFISHNLDDIFEVADRITVLRLGRNVGAFAAKETDAAAHRLGDHHRNPATGDAGPRMSVTAVLPKKQSLTAAVKNWWSGIRAGDVGNLPIILALVVIAVFFQAKNNHFNDPGNIVNLMVQMAGITTIGFGVVFVLLLGEIDLSVGYVSGVCGVVAAKLVEPPGTASGWSFHTDGFVAICIALVTGALIGLLQGTIIVKIGIPSFVVTLAGYLAWAGVVLIRSATVARS